MIIDANLMLWVPTTPITSGIVNGSNSVDLADQPQDQLRDLGAGKDLVLAINVLTSFTGGAGINFQLVLADDAGLATNPIVIADSGTIPITALVAPAKFALPAARLPAVAPKRYLGMCAVAAGSFTSGTISAAFVADYADTYRIYASKNPLY